MRRYLLLSVSLGLWACPREAEEPRKPRASPEGKVTLEGDSLRYVRVEKAEVPPPNASHPLFARVSFDERNMAVLGAPVSGRVSAVHVTTGTPVIVGQPVVTIHSADVGTANAALAEARHNRLLASQTAARAMQLVRAGAGSEAERQQAETAFHNAEDEERRALQAVRAMGLDAKGSDYVLKAPIAGTVVDRQVNVGNAVGADQGAPLITIANLQKVWVIVDVYEQDLPYVKAGHQARIEFPALRNRIYESTVTYVGDVVDADTRTARARIELDNADGALRPGMFAQVDVSSPEVASAWVPLSAVLARRDEFYVFVRNAEQQFVSRKVELGQERGDRVAILSGLQAGEDVVTRGAILLDAEANAAF